MIATVAAQAPIDVTISSSLLAVVRFIGEGKPCEMTVDSSATTGPFALRVAAIGAATLKCWSIKLQSILTGIPTHYFFSSGFLKGKNRSTTIPFFPPNLGVDQARTGTHICQTSPIAIPTRN